MGRVVAVCRVCGSHDVTVTFTGEDSWPTVEDLADRRISTPLVEEGTPSAEHKFTLRTEIPPQAWRKLNQGDSVAELAAALRDKRRAWREQKRSQRARKAHVKAVQRADMAGRRRPR